MRISQEMRKVVFDDREIELHLRKYEDAGLNLDYFQFLDKSKADDLFRDLEENVVYYSDEYSRVRYQCYVK